MRTLASPVVYQCTLFLKYSKSEGFRGGDWIELLNFVDTMTIKFTDVAEI